MQKHLQVILAIVLISCSLSGCSTKQIQDESAQKSDTSTVLPFNSPATFTGAIPCEECLQVDITLNILPDSMYQLRKVYRTSEGPSKIESQIGKWVYLPKDNLLILGKEQGLLKTYAVESSDKLLFVEWEGTDNASQIQYELLRSKEVDPFEDIIKITGDFITNSSGTGIITECSTELALPVSKEKDYTTLLQNYMNTPHDRDQPLLVSVLGKIVKGESGKSEMVIEHFNKIYPARNCEGTKVKTSLTGTFWHLLEVGDITVTTGPDEKRPYLLLNADRSFRAYANCNKITGTYLVKGDLFMINRKLDIRMACPEGIVLENELIKAFESTKSFRINGDMLELLDQNGQIRARFQTES
ncbi:MAG: META domain-containing protein [Desulforhopalus sp.]